jgi:hypothetical protein
MLLICPKCACADARVSLHLDSPDDFTCRECDEQFTAAEVRTLVESARRWEAVLAFAGRCPREEEAPAA